MDNKSTKGRKLSESRGMKLPNITISLTKKSETLSSLDKGNVSGHKLDQDEGAASLAPAEATPPIASSPVGYTLRHPIDVKISGSWRGDAQQTTPVYSRMYDSLDVTIYWPDERGFKFSLVGGKLATSSCLMLLLADHLGIDPEIFKEVCALWMVSDLLEVQLKPHHNPYDIRKNWMQFLSRFTDVGDNEAVDDEPLLMLKRNVQLSVERERQLEEEYTNDVLTEILYTSAKQEVLDGRYICDIDVSVNLAALQMAIELEPNEGMDLFGDEVAMYFPSKHRHNVKTLCFFGFPIIGCRGLETRIQEEYQDTKLKFENKHACRKAYLDIVRETPFYGAAFFRGHVERPRGGSLKEIKKMILSVTLPNIPVLVGINRDYVTLIDEAKQELLLAQRLNNCDWRCVEKNFERTLQVTEILDFPCFLLSFPDGSPSPDRALNIETEALEIPEKTKLLQVFSKQAVMIEALMNSLLALSEINLAGTDKGPSDEKQLEISVTPDTEVEIKTFDDDSSSQEVTFVTTIEVEMEGPDYSVLYPSGTVKGLDDQCKSSSCSPCSDVKRTGSSDKSMMNVGTSLPFICSLDKLCLATLDANGQCLDAQGSLRWILQEVN